MRVFPTAWRRQNTQKKLHMHEKDRQTPPWNGWTWLPCEVRARCTCQRLSVKRWLPVFVCFCVKRDCACLWPHPFLSPYAQQWVCKGNSCTARRHIWFLLVAMAAWKFKFSSPHTPQKKVQILHRGRLEKLHWEHQKNKIKKSKN